MNLAILQARMLSTRLPGKVLMPLAGKPMLLRQIERIKLSKHIDNLIVATTKDKSDDKISIMCEENGINYFRGSTENVLERFYFIAKLYQPNNIIRLTGDCPLIDASVIDKVIECHLKNGNDYTSNSIIPTYPDGLDTEVFTMETLERIYFKAKRPSLKEHVTLFIHENPKEFKIENVKHEEDISQLRWTVDEPEDYQLVNSIYESLYPINQSFTFYEVLSYLGENPELQKLNITFTRNEGLKKSLDQEKE